MGAAGSTPTFYHDYGAEGWVFNIQDDSGCDRRVSRIRLFHPLDISTSSTTANPAIVNTASLQDLNILYNDPSYTNLTAYNRTLLSSRTSLTCSPTITQYPRKGKVSQGSDKNISFNGDGYTYTIDMGPYVADQGVQGDILSKLSIPSVVSSNLPSTGGTYPYMWRSRMYDPINFRLKNSNITRIRDRYAGIRSVSATSNDIQTLTFWQAALIHVGGVIEVTGFQNSTNNGLFTVASVSPDMTVITYWNPGGVVENLVGTIRSAGALYNADDIGSSKIPFEIRKIEGDARGWPAWYLWVEEPLKPGTVLTFDVLVEEGNQISPADIYRRYTETRLGQTTGGVRYAPVMDGWGSTWTLNHP